MGFVATADARQRAIDETRNTSGDPQIAIAFAIIHLADVLKAAKS